MVVGVGWGAGWALGVGLVGVRGGIGSFLVAAAGEVALFNGFAFVVFLLALAGGDDEFDVAAAGEQADRDELEAVLLGAGEGLELFLRGEKFQGAGGVGAEGEIVEPEFAVTQSDEGTLELDMVVADEADFGTGEDETAAELVAELVVKAGAAIDGDGGGSL